MNRSNKGILVVGAGGFVGRALTQQLAKQGQRLTLLTHEPQFKFTGARVLHGDISNAVLSRKALRGVDVVYYVAGYKRNIEAHTRQPYDFFAGNVEPLLRFLDVLRVSKIKTFVYLSSALVTYHTLDNVGSDGYVLGKYANELAVQAFAQQVKKMKVTIVRSTAIYGPGDNFQPSSANFIPAIIQRVDASRETLTVWGRGVRKLQFIYIDDLVANLLAAARSSQALLYAVGNAEAKSVLQIVRLLVGLSGKKLTIVHDLSKPDKTTKLLKFTNAVAPRVNLRKGLQATLNYYHTHV